MRTQGGLVLCQDMLLNGSDYLRELLSVFWDIKFSEHLSDNALQVCFIRAILASWEDFSELGVLLEVLLDNILRGESIAGSEVVAQCHRYLGLVVWIFVDFWEFFVQLFCQRLVGVSLDAQSCTNAKHFK